MGDKAKESLAARKVQAEALKAKHSAERIGGIAAERQMAEEKERKAERKAKEAGTKESHQKLSGSGLTDAVALAKARVAAQASRENAAKAESGQHAAKEAAGKKERKEERNTKEAAKEIKVKQRTAKMRGCFITRQCCPKDGETCAEPQQKEYRDEWGEKHEQTAVDEFKCFARAQEVYDQCESSLPVNVKFGLTGGR